MMESILFPAVVAIIVFVGFLLILMKWVQSDEELHKKATLEKLSYDTTARLPSDENIDINLIKTPSIGLPDKGFIGFLALIPGVRSTYDLMSRAGLQGYRALFLLILYILLIISFLFFRWILDSVLLATILALVLMIFFARKFLKMRVKKRIDAFLNLFPDATDMMVRSVRAGHPLNAAMRMIAENMNDPVRSEFKEVNGEVAYGRPLTEALARLAYRIDSQDVHFFVVVLSVQQETGGSLSEVLSNLSSMLRKRKQLRLRIKAMTSEARAASIILGSLPVLEFVMLKIISPDYIAPMTSTLTGYILLGFASTLVILAITIIRNMANVEV